VGYQLRFPNLQCFIFSLITLHFKIKPSELHDCTALGTATDRSPTIVSQCRCSERFRACEIDRMHVPWCVQRGVSFCMSDLVGERATRQS
jgi:hypothetical protein